MNRLSDRLPVLLLAVGLGTVALTGGVRAEDEDSWASFRGRPAQTGRAETSLPAEMEPVWTFEAGGDIESTAAIADGRVFVASMEGVVHALSLESGEEIWRYEAGYEIKSSPLVSEGVVYLGDELGVFHALAAETGERIWTFEADAAITSSANASGNCLVFGSYDGFIYCLDPASGELRWKVETDGYVHGTPGVADDSVFSAGCDGYFRSIDLDSGAVSASVSVDGYVGASPAIDAGVAYVGTFESEVLAINLADSKILWRYKHPDRHFAFYSSAALTEEMVILGGRDKFVHGIDRASGKEKWVHQEKSRIDSSPVLVGDRVFVATDSGDLVALKTATGEEVWRFETGSAFSASPAVASNRLVISTIEGMVIAFGG